MPAPAFLKYEKKKVVLPLALVVMLIFLLVYSAVFAERARNDVAPAVDSSLDVLKLAVYNGSLNGSDLDIETQLVVKREASVVSSQKYYSDLVLVSGTPYAIQYTLNTFGTRFCIPDIYLTQPSGECVDTKIGLVLLSETVRLIVCASEFTSTAYNKTAYPGNILAGNDFYQKSQFIHSEEGWNIFDHLENCSNAADFIFDPQKVREMGIFQQDFFPNKPVNVKIRYLNAADISFYIVILLAIGYLVSCAVIWAHRKNHILDNKGRRMYGVLLAFLALFLFASMLLSSKDFLFNFRYIFFASLFLSYLGTTLVYKKSQNPQEEKILRDVRIIKNMRKKR
jgi:hypothetical protein